MKARTRAQDLAWRFVDLFVAEAREHVAGAVAESTAWATDGAASRVAAFRRHAHSLRGMAATMGLDAMAEVARRLEAAGLERLEPADVARATAALRDAVEAVAAGEPPDDAALVTAAAPLDAPAC